MFTVKYLGLRPGSRNGYWKKPMHKLSLNGKIYYQAVEGNCIYNAKRFAISADQLVEALQRGDTIVTRGQFFSFRT